MIKAIIFDLWETLGTKNIGISKLFFDHFNIPIQDRILENYEQAVQLKAWSREEDMVKSLLQNFNINITTGDLAWTQSLFRKGIRNATLFPETLELLESLRRKYKLALISNTSIFESKVLDRLKMRNFFDVISFSWELQDLKPSARIFHQTLQKLEVLPEEAIFIDDGQKNVDAAIALKIHGLRFKNMPTLKQELSKLNI